MPSKTKDVLKPRHDLTGEVPKSSGRSNCTIFLDHPELLFEYEMPAPKLPTDVDVPAYMRRQKLVKR